MIIGFSLGALRNCDWNIIDKINFLKSIGANALEIPFREPDLLFEFELTEKILEALKGFEHLSIHAPFSKITYKDDLLTHKVIKKLKDLNSILNVKAIIIHPNNVENFSILEKSNLPILIENMDLRKDSFKNEKEIQKVFDEYSFKFVLDLEHSFENDPTLNLTNNLIKLMGNRLKEIHLSGAKKSSDINENNHCFITESPFREQICSRLKELRNIPIILEVTAEKNDEDSLKNELNYVRKYDNTNT
jgi:endonuclease IV